MQRAKRSRTSGNEVKTSEHLTAGRVYTRKELAKRFQITDATLKNGIFRPAGHRSVWLFITEKKTKDRIQYIDRLEGDVLDMEGQSKRGRDHLITEPLGLELLVFHRKKKNEHPGAGFRYEGVFRYEGHSPGFVDPGVGPICYRLRRASTEDCDEGELDLLSVAEPVPSRRARASAGQGGRGHGPLHPSMEGR